jgi:hypothetical protein
MRIRKILPKILPHFDKNQKRRHKDYIGLYLGFLVFAATGAKVKCSIDQINFLFLANVGFPVLPLFKTISFLTYQRLNILFFS